MGYAAVFFIGGGRIMKCVTCLEVLDQKLGCINCFCIQYWLYDKKDLPTDIQDLREKDIFKPTINI